MSNTITHTMEAPQVKEDALKWQKSDTTWMLSLYGTAIGAGVLFLPIRAGAGGLIPLLFIICLAFPMAYFAHRGLCRYVLAGKDPTGDITVVTKEFFGPGFATLITLLYFLIIFPILLIYSVGLTNTTLSFLQNQIHVLPADVEPSFILRSGISFLIVFALMGIIHFGQAITLKVMSYLVYPFIAVLMVIALWMIQYWNGAIFGTMTTSETVGGTLKSLWLAIPIMIFAFNHSPIISSLAVAKKQEYGPYAEQKCSRIIKYANMLMVGTVMFFVVSCVLALSPESLQQAKNQNLPVLSYIANHFGTPFFAYLAPAVAFVAMAKSFFGHYLGAKEGFNGLLQRGFNAMGKNVGLKTLDNITLAFIFITSWGVAILNPNVLDMIENMVGPIIASILFLLPMYAIHKVPALAPYKGKLSNIFVVIVGLIAISAIVYGLLPASITG